MTNNKKPIRIDLECNVQTTKAWYIYAVSKEDFLQQLEAVKESYRAEQLEQLVMVEKILTVDSYYDDEDLQALPDKSS